MNPILKIFMEKGFLLDKDLLNFLNELDDTELAKEIIDKIAIVSNKKLITKNLVSENLDKLKPILFELEDNKKKIVEKYFVNVSISIEVRKESAVEEVEDNQLQAGNVKVLSCPIISSQKLTVKDFIKHFRNRYNFMKGLLQQRPELDNLISIDKIGGNNRNFSIIGMVVNKTITKNKNLILEVEDLTGKAKILVKNDNEELFEKSKEILLDDIIGFKCAGTREFLFANDIVYPDAILETRNRTEEEIYAVFISDIHLGSGNFLEKNFNKFIDWLNGVDCSEEQKRTLKKINYMFVVGDSIDGVGIYPGQEKDLVIKDMKKQYEELAKFYERIPKHISIIQCAGQHDGVRVAEPQPPIGDDFGEPLHKFENLHLVSNPSMIEIGATREKKGLKVLMYHGASMHGVINEIEELRLNNAHSTPARVVRHLLFRRHLAPTHGATVYIPDSREDPMTIKEVPDIITTGDLHKTDIDKYNGTLIICNSCWQSMTAFEEKVGNQPDPCKVPIVNLKTGAVKILDFSDEEGD